MQMNDVEAIDYRSVGSQVQLGATVANFAG
jgi:hypothetical protein